MKNILFPIILLSIILSCNESSEDQVDLKIYDKQPEMNLSTPDETVRSILKFTEWYDSTQSKVLKSFTNSFMENLLSAYVKETADTIKESYKNLYDPKKKDKKKLKVDNVDIQSDTRAIVTVNTGEKTWGIYSDEVMIVTKYTLYKSGSNWLVENIEQTCFTCDGSGKVKDYDRSSLYNTYYKACENCGGDGWKSTIFE